MLRDLSYILRFSVKILLLERGTICVYIEQPEKHV